MQHNEALTELEKKRMTEVASLMQKKGLSYSKQEMAKGHKRPKSSAQDYARDQKAGSRISTQFIASSDLMDVARGTGTADTSD